MGKTKFRRLVIDCIEDGLKKHSEWMYHCGNGSQVHIKNTVGEIVSGTRSIPSEEFSKGPGGAIRPSDVANYIRRRFLHVPVINSNNEQPAHPGEILSSIMGSKVHMDGETVELTPEILAKAIQVPVHVIVDLLARKINVNTNLGIRLSVALCKPSSYFVLSQVKYDLYHETGKVAHLNIDALHLV